MRVFFSIPVPQSVAERLLALVPPIRGLRRARSDSIHLTLHFLLNAPADLADRLNLTPLPVPFTLTPGKLILLPESGPVSVVAASIITGTDALRSLHTTLAAELTRLALPVDTRKFLPHLTLARANPSLPQQLRSQSPMVPRDDVSFQVSEVVLFESRPSPAGAGVEHQPLRMWPLQPVP